MSITDRMARQVDHDTHHLRVLLAELAYPDVFDYQGAYVNRFSGEPIRLPFHVHYKTVRAVKT
jgi:hypothetical protein